MHVYVKFDWTRIIRSAHAQDFPRDPEPEVEGGDSCVVAVRNRKQHDAQVKKQDTLLVRRGDSLHS